MASGTTERFEWRRRRVAAAMVRGLTILIPVIFAVAVSVGLGKLLPSVSGRPASLTRIAVILVITTLAMLWASRRMERFLPLAVMLKLSWAFPDRVPSRFRVALRQVRHKQPSIDAPTPTVSEHLIDLVQRLNVHHRATRGHSERVRAYADLLGEELGLDAQDRDKLCWAALLHDIGKIAVPAEILDFPGRPDADQWAILSTHPAAGETIAASVIDWLGPWANGIWEHHERWDAAGYPRRAGGEAISLSGRIIAVADSFETMTAVRPYKKPMSLEDARQKVVRCAGAHFDPTVVRAFLAIGLGRLGKVRGLAAFIQAPLVVLSQAGEAAKNVMTTTAAGGAAAMVIAVSGAATAGPTPKQPTAAVTTTVAVPSTTAASTTSTTVADVVVGGYNVGGALPVGDPEPTSTPADTAAPSTFAEPVQPASDPQPIPPTTARPNPSTAPPPQATTTPTAAPSVPTATPTSTTEARATSTTTTTIPPTTSTTTTTTTTVPPTTSTTTTTTTTTPSLSVRNDALTIDPGVWTTIEPLANDTGPFDLSSLTIITGAPGLNIDVEDDGTLDVRAAPGHAGTVKVITYEICNGAGACAQATITITVRP